MKKRSNKRGFTLLEMTVSLSLVASVLFGLAMLVRNYERSAQTEAAGLKLSTDALDVLSTVVEDLGRSGFVELGGEQYPLFFPSGDPPDGFENFSHDEPHELDEDAPESTDIVFPLPSDANGDNWPDMLDKELEWAVEPLGYLLLPAPDGTNTLVRRGADGVDRTVARSVRRITFEDPEDTGFEIPLDTVRVTVVLGRNDADGRLITREVSAVVALMNGWVSQ